MLDGHIPANLHYFLVDYLSLIRLESGMLGSSVDAWQKERSHENYKLVIDKDSSYSGLHNMCGYKHAFSRNLIIVIFVAMALLLIIVGIYLCRLIRSTRRPPRHAVTTMNFGLRFVYEFFLEICICVVINLASYKANANAS